MVFIKCHVVHYDQTFPLWSYTPKAHCIFTNLSCTLWFCLMKWKVFPIKIPPVWFLQNQRTLILTYQLSPSLYGKYLWGFLDFLIAQWDEVAGTSTSGKNGKSPHLLVLIVESLAPNCSEMTLKRFLEWWTATVISMIMSDLIPPQLQTSIHLKLLLLYRFSHMLMFN